MQNTNWAILGCGHIAHKFAEDIIATEGATLYAVGSRSLEKANNFKQQHQAQKAYASYEALVRDPEVDIIYIATPHVFHKEVTILCLTHGKAVLCEKPFAMNRNEVEDMIAFAKAKKTFLMEALWTYFLPHYQFALQTLHSGELGTIKSLKADFGIDVPKDPSHRLYNKDLGGGSLLDVGIYPVFAAMTILGTPEKIEAKATFDTNEIDLNCEMELTYPNQVKAHLFSAIDTQTDTICHIELEKGTIHIHSRFHDPSGIAITITKNGSAETIDFPTKVHGYHHEILHCQEMLAQDRKESNIMTFEKSIQLITLLDTIRKEIGLVYG
ncbi:Gfo/Idh/MocA family oxidoreductase [uncultured Dokdonia sp.]|uniref:Gfo/Idh/MocA family protein n=1 Tax=uncultured Dokdonia sp. TaxID=575653 RepID=UPI0026171168|nr:Gfo/Idh/MocA family oxidoreductase [uncultured Dokdonia sp.]